MGIRGFQRWLAQLGCNQDLNTVSRPGFVDHLLIDMNGVMHQAYDLQEPSLKKTLERTVRKTRDIILKLKPNKSLTLVFDGSAPLAKLQTQRERRQGYAVVEAESPQLKKQQQRAKNLDDAEENKSNNNNNDDDDDNNGEQQQQQKRRGVAITSSRAIPTTATTERPLSEEEVTTGSPYVVLVENAVTSMVLSQLVDAEKLLSADLDVLISRSTDVGEGEVKIGLRLQTLSPKPVDDTVVIFSSDSDCVLVGVAALNFHNIWIVHPSMNFCTSVGFLLLKWMDSKLVDSLTIREIPSARVDFVFIMNLSGGDFYTGLEEGDAAQLWNRYRAKRTCHGSGGDASSGLVQALPAPSAAVAVANPGDGDGDGDDAEDDGKERQPTPPSKPQYQHSICLNPELFLEVIGKPKEEKQLYSRGSGGGGGGKGKTPNQRMKNQQKGSKAARQRGANGNPGQGGNLASFALWSVEQFISGRCEAFGVQTALSDNPVPMSALRAFACNANSVAACRPRRTPLLAGDTSTSLECLRPPIFTFIAAAARTSSLPMYVRRVLDENPPLRSKLARVTSSVQLAAATDEVLSLVRASVALAKPGDPNTAAIVQQVAAFPGILADPDASVTGMHAPVASAWKECFKVAHHTAADIAEIRSWCLSFEYEPGTVLKFRGITKNDITVVVPEKKAAAAAAAASNSEKKKPVESSSSDEAEIEDDN